MKTTKAKRKLIPRALVLQIVERQALGVPLSRIIKDLRLDISRTSLKSILDVYKAVDSDSPCEASLFPPWLTKEAKVQEQPSNWYYQGYFPWGCWKND